MRLVQTYICIKYRLYASIIAKRLEHIIPDLIDTDQTRFIKQRQTYDNVWRTLHLMDFVDKTKSSAPLISLDAENTFDSVRWEFFYLVSQRFGFNEKAINCFKSLYSSPTARIKINGNISNSIALERGCRQGCPLSPTLFALFIEPLAQRA